MNDSILTSIKKLLGITAEYTVFDQDIIIHINTVFFTLRQIGVGPADGFNITDSSQTWGDFLGNSKNLEAVKTYIYQKVRLLFDPPQNSAFIEAIKASIAELEWRLNVEVDPGKDNI